jgi:hypothetical protein
MNETLSPEDRRHVRTSLTASLAVVFTLVLGSFAWAGVNPPAAEASASPRATVSSAAPAAADESQNVMVGCGCAEGCVD